MKKFFFEIFLGATHHSVLIVKNKHLPLQAGWKHDITTTIYITTAHPVDEFVKLSSF